ncbi:MICAL-like protein 2 isoform X2 [Mixophyes fleayi]|uniref:MICAL-like protein 2 isoform X2 n=1 Tax=Mixophyes fleayi TaxID=3061075 RepID=UPI003F4DDD84
MQLGGLAAVKRPPPDAIEEPAGKKTPNHNASSPQTTPAKQPPHRSPDVIENAPVRAGIREINPNSGVSSNCSVCGKHVHLVQRHMADGKLYHRNCFRCKQCSRTLQPGGYKAGEQPGTLICKDHLTHTPSPTATNVSASGPYTPVVSSVGGNLTYHTTQPGSTSTNKPWQSTPSPSVPAPNNRTAVGFVDNNKITTGVPGAAGQEPANKVTHNFQSTVIKNGPSSANTINTEPTNRTALGFYGNTKTNVSNVSGPGKLDNFLPRSNSFQREAKNELGQFGQQSKVTGATGNVPSVSSLSSGRSSATKDETKEQNTTPKSWLSSTAKNKEAREAFFLSKPVTEPTANQFPSGRESPKTSVSNEPGRSVTITVTPQTPEANAGKDKARNFLLKNIPGSTSPKSVRATESANGISTPNRTTDPHPKVTESFTPKTEPVKPVPKERKSKVPTSVSSPEPPKSTPTYTAGKGVSTPSSDKGPVPAQRSQPAQPTYPAQPSVLHPGRVQKVDEPSPKTQNPGTIVSKPEDPAAWRSMLKSVEKKPAAQRTLHEAKPTPKEPEMTTGQKKPTTVVTSTIWQSPAGKNNPTAPTVPTTTPRPADKEKNPMPPTGPTSTSKPAGKENKSTQPTAPTYTPSPAGKESKPTRPTASTYTPSPAGKENKSTQPTAPTYTPSPAGKESKPTQPTAATSTPNSVAPDPANGLHPRRKLLTAKIDLINDWPKIEQKWQDGALVAEGGPPSWRPHLIRGNDTSKNSSTTDKTSKDDLVEDNNLASPNKLRPEYIPEEVIQKQLQIIEHELDSLEQRGVELEKQLRVSDGEDPEDSLMVDWFKLIHKKQLLLREESELNYISKQQALEDQQQDVETELRNLMNKPDHLKSQWDRAREQKLLEQYLLIVNDRSEIIECLDEDRLREKEEDEVMENMIKKHTDSQQKQPSPESSSKRRSRFSFSGWLRPKDKNKT